MSNKKIKDDEHNSRRDALKTIALGSGTIATAASLPTSWTKPILNQVMLPAHAQTSDVVIMGTFSSGATLGLRRPNQVQGFASTQYALLDALIPTAKAGHPGARAFCGTDNEGDGVSDSKIYFDIDDAGNVQIAIDSLDESQGSVCGITSTLTDTRIANADIRIATFDHYWVRLTNMVASATEITGDYATAQAADQDNDDGPRVPGDGTDDEETFCTGSFSAMIGGSFPSSYDTACGDDGE